jgi:hypothetical protein
MSGFFKEYEAVVDIPELVIDQDFLYILSGTIPFYDYFRNNSFLKDPCGNPQSKGRGSVMLSN